MENKYNVLAISGSLRAGSFNTGILREIAAVGQQNLTIQIASLKGIPVYDGDDETATGLPDKARDLVDQIRAADAVVISTPEYNAAIPGGLKNAIDWVSRAGDQPFAGKPVAVIGAAAGITGGSRAQSHLRDTLASVDANTMNLPEIFVGAAHTKFDEEGSLRDDDTRAFVKIWLGAFVEWLPANVKA